MYGLVIESDSSTVCTAVTNCGKTTFRHIGIAEYICVPSCSEGENTIENYMLGQNSVTLCVESCETYDMIEIEKKCVTPCPESYAITVDNEEIRCI